MIRLDSSDLRRNNKIIFSKYNLHIREKDKCLIRAKSGAGKTTFFKVLLGFESLDNGRVLFKGEPVSKKNIREVRSQIFYLSQDVDLKDEIVRTLLDEIRQAADPDSENNDETRIRELFNFLDLDPGILKQRVKELSGGERQRLGLAIGCLLDRPVWLLDEPTSALDDASKEKVAAFISGMDKTVVVISHDAIWDRHPEIRIERWD